MTNWYVSSVQWTAVTAWAANTAYSIGNLRRQLAAPTVGNERVFRCTTAGTSHATTEPTWTITAGGTTNDGTVVWTEVTGQEAYQASGAWGAPHARIENAEATGWCAAGDKIMVATDHNSTRSTAAGHSSPGTIAAPCEVICVALGGSIPPVEADYTIRGYTETCTAGSAITFAGGYCSWRGGIHVSGSGASSNVTCVISQANNSQHNFSGSKISLGTTNANGRITAGEGTINRAYGPIVLDNTQLSFASASQSLQIKNAHLIWRGTASAIQGTVPTKLITGGTGEGQSSVELDGLDLSASVTAGNKIFSTFTTAVKAFVTNCKLHANLGICDTPTCPGSEIINMNSDDSTSAKGNRFEKYSIRGQQLVERTNILTGGGFENYNDNVEASVIKLVTDASNCNRLFPLSSLPIDYPNDVTGSPVTLTFPILVDNFTPKNIDLYATASYLSAASEPIAATVTTKVGSLSAGTNLTGSAATWNTSGLTSGNPFQIALTMTPAKAGLIRVTFYAALAGKTFLIGKPVVT